jgi:tetratricopeptide (TPR) repeat protein
MATINDYVISPEALHEAAADLRDELGDISDLPSELVNTLANVYYRFFANLEHIRCGGNTRLLEAFLPKASSMHDAFKNYTVFNAQSIAAYENVKGMVVSARTVRTEEPEFYPYLITLILDMFKYNIDKAGSKTPIRRGIERKFKTVYEIQNLFELMQSASVNRMHQSDDGLVAVPIEEKIQDQREVALGLMRQNKFSEALPILLLLIENNSDDWSLYYMAGQCSYYTNKNSDALKLLYKALKLNQNEVHLLFTLGLVLQKDEAYEVAIKVLKKAISLAPSFFEAYNSLGLTYRKNGQFREALEWYSKAAEGILVLKDKERCFRESIVDGNKSVDILPYVFERTHEMLRSDPTYAIIKNNMGVCLLELGDINAARKQFEESIQCIPDGYKYPDPFKHLELIG